jgi:hypothetical protein
MFEYLLGYKQKKKKKKKLQIHWEKEKMCRVLIVLCILGKNKNIITIFINVFTIHANEDSYFYIPYSQRSMIITV